MVSDSLLIAGAGLLGAEALGITNLFGGADGQQSPISNIPAIGGDGGPSIIPFPSGSTGQLPPIDLQLPQTQIPAAGAGLGQVTGEFADLIGQQTGQITDLTGQVGAQASTIADLQRRLERLRNQVPTGGDGVQNPFVPDGGGGTGEGTSTGDSGLIGGLTPRQQAAEAAGRDPFSLQATGAGPVARGAEAARSAGETVNQIVEGGGSTLNDIIDFAGTSGRTAGQAARLLAGETVSTEGTFAEGPEGGERRQLLSGPILPQGPVLPSPASPPQDKITGTSPAVVGKPESKREPPETRRQRQERRRRLAEFDFAV